MVSDINVTYKLRLMEKQDALEIGNWKYEQSYSLYNSSADQESLEELLDGSYYAWPRAKAGIHGDRAGQGIPAGGYSVRRKCICSGEVQADRS